MRGFTASLTLLGLLVPGALAASTGRPWLTSVDAAFAEAARTDRAILVDLYAEWCGWCKRLEEDVFSTPSFQEFAEDFVLLRVDTEDRAEGTRLQQKYEAFSLPTTLVIDSGGVLMASIPGYSPAPQFIATIESKIAAFDELVDGYERFRESSDPRILGILADEFHKRNDGVRAAAIYRRLLATGQLSPKKSLRIRYQLSDALRLARQYDDAWQEIETARSSLSPDTDDGLEARFDLLAAQVSIDRGDCSHAQTALETFLNEYPTSDLRRVARQALATLKAKGYQCS